jgi:hypothetical protein
MTERCEWDPVRDSAAEEADGCPNEATLSVGADGNWHLCESCAALPEFDCFRKRVPLDPRVGLVAAAAKRAELAAERLARRREVPIGKGGRLIAYVDAEDLDLVMRYRWTAKPAPGEVTNEWGPLTYAHTSTRVIDPAAPLDKPKNLLMHRLILGQSGEFGTSHRDGNGLNNQRYNIAPATQAENNRNLRVHREARELNERQSEVLRSTIAVRLNGPERRSDV